MIPPSFEGPTPSNCPRGKLSCYYTVITGYRDNAGNNFRLRMIYHDLLAIDKAKSRSDCANCASVSSTVADCVQNKHRKHSSCTPTYKLQQNIFQVRHSIESHLTSKSMASPVMITRDDRFVPGAKTVASNQRQRYRELTSLLLLGTYCTYPLPCMRAHTKGRFNW